MVTSSASSEQVLNGTTAHVGEQVDERLDPPGHWLSIEDAAVALGLNQSTVRRHVREQKLPSKRIKRPQGYILRVFVPESQLADPSLAQLGELGPPDSDQPGGPSWVPTSAQLATPLDPSERAQAMAAYSRELLEPLVEALERSEARAREQAETIGQLRADLATVRAELGTLKAAQAPVDASGAPGPPEPTTDAPAPWWRRWRAWLAALVLGVMAFVLALSR